MAANLLKKDTCFSLQKEWHGLETIVPEITYETSGLDWTVERQPILLESTGKQIKGHFAVYCPEKEEVIQVAKDSYTLIQNSQLFEIMSEGLAGIPFKIVAAISLGNLQKVAVTVALEEKQDYLINGEEFKNFVTFASSHNGSMNLYSYDTSIKSICGNTLQWSLADKGILNLKVRHTKNSQVKIENMKQQIETLFKKREEWYTSYERLSQQPMSLEQAEKILFGFEAKNEISTRTRNKVGEIHQLFQNGLGNKGVNVGDIFGAITEYYTSKSSSNPGKAWASSEFGLGRDKKLAFWSAIEDGELDKLAKRGEKLLALSV
jgi:hypothetical protein